MTKPRHAEPIDDLREKLQQLNWVREYDSQLEEEATRLAHALVDIIDSCSKIANEIAPKIFGSTGSNQELTGLVWEVRDELRHMLYHVNDSRYLGKLLNE